MKNVKEIIVSLPQLDDTLANCLSVSVYKKEDSNGNSGFQIELSPIVNVLESIFKKEFEELQEKYERLVKQAFEENFDMDELEKLSTNRFIGLNKK